MGNKENNELIQNEEIKLLDKIEILLNGIILMFGNFFVTFWSISFKTERIKSYLSDNSDTREFQNIVKPITYFFISFLLFLFISSEFAIKIDDFVRELSKAPLFGGNEIGIFNRRIISFSNNVIDNYFQSDFYSGLILLYIIPIIFLTALFAKLSSVFAKLWKITAPFSLHFYFFNYIFGTALILISYFFSVFIVIGLVKGDITITQLTYILASFIITPYLFLNFIFKYLKLYKNVFSISWFPAIIINLLSLLISLLIVYLIFDIL